MILRSASVKAQWSRVTDEGVSAASDAQMDGSWDLVSLLEAACSILSLQTLAKSDLSGRLIDSG